VRVHLGAECSGERAHRVRTREVARHDGDARVRQLALQRLGGFKM